MFKLIAGYIIDAVLDKLKEEKVLEQGKAYAEGIVKRSDKLGGLRDKLNEIIDIPNQFFDGMGFQGTLLKQVIGIQIEKLAEKNPTVKEALSVAGKDFYKEILDGLKPGELLNMVAPIIEQKIVEVAGKVQAKLGETDGGFVRVEDGEVITEPEA